MADSRKILLDLKLNGEPVIVRPTGSAPLEKLEIQISTIDPQGKKELMLGFGIDVGRGQGQGPLVQDPP